MPTPILTTKLHIPPVPANLIPRARLIEKFKQGLDKKLTLVSAPAGFGKTTLLSECVEKCHFPVAWYSMDEGDNDPARFINHLIASIQIVDHRGAKNFLLQADPSRFSSIENVLTEIINKIDKTATKCILVFDDYHVIESPEIDQAIIFLLSNMPPNLHIVIATRTDPTFPLPLFRSRGQLTEIRVDDLRFSYDEATQFLKNGMGLEVSSEDVAALDSRMEGWIAGFQLAAISLQGLSQDEEVSSFIKDFSGSHRYILDYLTDEVLAQRPEGTQGFLLKTSILDRFSASLCNTVLGIKNSQEILESLEAANLFIIPLDDERIWYRYHHLFGDLLRIRLERSDPLLVSELHRRASDWYTSNDLIPEAITHSLAAEDFERAAELTELTFIDRMSRGEDLSMMMARLAALPDELIRAHPRLSIMFAWMLSLTLQLHAVEPRLKEVEAKFGNQLSADLHRQIASIRAEVARNQGEYQKSIDLSLKVLNSIPNNQTFTDQQNMTGLVSNLAWGYLLAGEVKHAYSWFSESLKIGQHSITLSLLGLNGLARTQIVQGRLHDAIESCQLGLKLIKDTPQKIDGEVPSAIYIYMCLGALLRESGKLDDGGQHLSLALKLGQKWNAIGDTMRDIYIEMAKLKLSLADFPGAMDMLNEAENIKNQYASVPHFIEPIETQKARVQIAWYTSKSNQAVLDAVKQWAENRNFSIDGSTGSFHDETDYLVWVRLLIVQGELSKAIKVLTHLVADALEKGRMGRVIEMYILQSLAYQGCGESSNALNSLSLALEMAKPEGYMRIFLDEGLPMKEVLQLAADQGIMPSYVSILLKAYDKLSFPKIRVGRSLASIPQNTFPLVEPLTERECEVLRLLSKGLTNQEIALELVIAVTTAKKHVSNIIGKLGVSNRTQAVSRAKELSLID